MDGAGHGEEGDPGADWLRRISDVNLGHFSLDMDRAALLVVDMQRVFLEGTGRVQDADRVTGNVAALADHFRSAGRPVIYTRHLHREDGSDGGNLLWWWGGLIKEGSRKGELVEAVAPREGDTVIRKNTYSAFAGTGLEDLLRGMGVEELVVTGVMTNICCETTARDAFVRNFRVKFVADATGTATEAMQVASLLNLAYAFADVCLTRDVIDGRA